MKEAISEILKTALAEVKAFDIESIKIVALDFHPWNGFLAICLLTEEEFREDPLLDDPAEMAAWKHYDISSRTSSWPKVSDSPLADIKSEYEASKDADSLFAQCVDALKSQSVQEALQELPLSESVRYSVAHPDNGHEYFK